MKIIIAGKSATGKDTLAGLLKEKGMKVCKSYATRKKRSEDEDTHVFITPEEAAAVPDEKKFARTVINGNEYFTSEEQAQKNDVFVLDPKGIHDLTTHMPECTFIVVYMRASDQVRKDKALGRADDSAAEQAVFSSRDKEEDEMFAELERKVLCDEPIADNVVGSILYTNDYNMDSLRRVADNVYSNYVLRVRMQEILKWALMHGVVSCNAVGHIRVVNLDLSIRYVSPDHFIEEVVGSDEGFASIVKQYLSSS